MSPRTKEQFEQMRQQSIEIILDAALKLFAHQGYHRTSISQIAKEAGISKGLIYNYFDTKEDLLHGLMQDAFQLGDDLLKAHMTNAEESPLEKIYAIIDGMVTHVKEHVLYWKLMTKLSVQDDIAHIVESEVLHKGKENIGQIAALLQELGVQDIESEAILLASTFDGIFLHYIRMEDQYPLNQIIELLKQNIAMKANSNK